jgi:hypothetical protein
VACTTAIAPSLSHDLPWFRGEDERVNTFFFPKARAWAAGGGTLGGVGAQGTVGAFLKSQISLFNPPPPYCAPLRPLYWIRAITCIN